VKPNQNDRTEAVTHISFYKERERGREREREREVVKS
jgi:hypothetical protein